MNFAIGNGNPDDRVREYVKGQQQLEHQERRYRARAEAAASCGKRDTASNALAGAERCAAQRAAE